MTIRNQQRRDSCAAVRRFDVADMGELRPASETDEGFAHVDVFIAKPGVLVYEDRNGETWRELITAEELHRADSLETLAGKPVTLEHPPEDVDPDNVEKFGQGTIGTDVAVMRDGRVRITYMVHKRDAIRAIQNGSKREASPGYRCDIVNEGGTHPEFGPYDRIQKNRRYNHGAICARARGGPEIHLRYDSDARMVAPSTNYPRQNMDPELVKQIIEALTANGVPRADAEKTAQDMAAMREENKKLKADMAAMKKKLDEYEKDSKKGDEDGPEDDDEKKTDALAFFNERTELVAAASRFDAIDPAKFPSNDDLRKAVVLAANPNARQDGSAEYYEAAFDMLEVRTDAAPVADERPSFARPEIVRNDGHGNQNNTGQARNDSGMPDPEAGARQTMAAMASKR